jgi:hypothetical protein
LLTAKARCRIFAADTRGALAASNAALDAVGPIIDAASDVESLFVGVEAWLIKGDAQSLGKQKDLAVTSWSRALELSGRIESPSRPYTRMLRAMILSRLDRSSEARSIIDELQAMNYRHPLLRSLTKESG